MLIKYWGGSKYVGITMTWDYVKREFHITMRGYVKKLLHRFQHDTPTKMQHQPHPQVPPNYVAKRQRAIPLDDSQPLDKEGNKCIIQVTGPFLKYSRADDGTILRI